MSFVCKYCGGPCTQDGPRLGLTLDRKRQPRFKVRCELGVTEDCRTKTQTISPESVPHGWRLLIRTSRMTERYHALRQLHQNAAEGEFANARKRYALFGNDMSGKLKRFGIEAQELRLAMSRFLDWFRICLRHGWIGKHPRINSRLPIKRRGEKRLRAMLLARRERNLNLPYGEAAFAMNLAPDAAVLPKLKRRPRDHGPPATYRSSGANN